MENIPIHLEHKKAKRSFRIILSLGLVFILFTAGLSFSGLPIMVNLTQMAYQVSTCTGIICSKCLFSLPTLKIFLGWIGITVLYVGIIRALYKSYIEMRKDRFFRNGLRPLLVKEIPLLDKLICQMNLPGNVFVPFKNDSIKCAFTGGILRPRIFLSTGICNYLTQKELKLVILHELYHYRENAPLKSYIISIIQDLLFFIPFVRYMVSVFLEVNENAADDHVVAHSKDSGELACALLKVGKANNPKNLPALISPISGPRLIHSGTSFQRLEKRIKRLTGCSYDSPGRRYKKLAILSVFIHILMFIAILSPVVSGKSLYFKGQGVGRCYLMAPDNINSHDNDFLDCCKN